MARGAVEPCESSSNALQVLVYLSFKTTQKTMKIQISFIALLLAMCIRPTFAVDLSKGLMAAVPVKNQPPTIDGDLSDWDLSRAEPMWVSEQVAAQLNAEWALMYDDEALYIGVRASLPNRALQNPNSPQDSFWQGDLLQMRLGVDPQLAYPLSNDRDVKNERIVHLSLWKNTESGQDYLHLNRGIKFDLGQDFNPPGSAIKIVAHGDTSYTAEARVPWAALRVPGGKNPFKAGDKAAIVVEALWVGGDQARVAAVYRENPGTFAFMQTQTWGQVEFLAHSDGARVRPTLQSLLAQFGQKNQPAAQIGVPFEVQVPDDNLKVSVNIFGGNGEVVRELMGGEAHTKGPLTVRWDGKDQWGHAMAPGNYRWGAYFSPGLQAHYMGGVGKSGHPYYETGDGKSGWGADHSNPVDVAADASGMYFLWPVAEGGRNIVKTDYGGSVLWRKTPFVGGGFGPLYAVASNGKTVFISFGENQPQLLRLEAATGQLMIWGDGASLVPISDSAAIKVPPESSPLSNHASFGQASAPNQPETVGLAASENEVFASVYSQNVVQVLAAQTGKPVRTLSCPGPRGLALSKAGDLFVVSFVLGQTPRVLRFARGQGAGIPVVTQGLEAPWDVTIDAMNRVLVSDGGQSQQIKFFAGQQQVAAWGKKGGRAWAGAYDEGAFLQPAGLAADARGGVLVAESSLPKVMSRWDAQSGKSLGHWFGAPSYWTGTWPEPDDPWTMYYQINDGFARAKIPAPGENGDRPQAYWDLATVGMASNGGFDDLLHVVLIADNGRKYFAGANNPNGIALLQGDKILPIAHFKVFDKFRKDLKIDKTYLEIWQDKNGDHREQPDEITHFDTVAGKPLVDVADWGVTSSYLMPNGDFYVTTLANKILKFPSSGFAKDGSMGWDLGKASYVVPKILPSLGDNTYAGPRGLSGVRVDGNGDIYTAISQIAPGLTPELEAKLQAEFPNVPRTNWGAWASPELANAMKEGMGHSGESNIAKFIKYAPDGHILWMAGRKATAGARLGEMYHFWALAGLVGDDYVVGASEWGPFTFYTSDGFYVDKLMNDPAQNPAPGPYTFGGETGAGRVQFFPKQDEVWVYSVGRAFRVSGFQGGKVQGERRVYGTVALDKIYEAQDAPTVAASPLQIMPINGDALNDAKRWQNVTTSTLHREDAPLATAQFGYDANFLYGRIHVNDDSPLQNGADNVNLAFKGGDAVALVLGSAAPHDAPLLGDIRIMAAMIGGQPRFGGDEAINGAAKATGDLFHASGGPRLV